MKEVRVVCGMTSTFIKDRRLAACGSGHSAKAAADAKAAKIAEAKARKAADAKAAAEAKAERAAEGWACPGRAAA